MKSSVMGAALLVSSVSAIPQPAWAQRAQIVALRGELATANAKIDAQERRLRDLEARLETFAARGASLSANTNPMPGLNAAQGSASISPGNPAGIQVAQVETVGAAPADFGAPAIAVLGDMGSVITRRGQLTAELGVEYARADRNRALFRGIEVVESVLVGVFDINESRQDVISAAASVRYGLSSRFEIGARLPFVYRNDASVLAPIQGSTTDDDAATIDSSANGSGIGDVEISARYQLTKAIAGRPFLIGNLQVVAPTGSNPFDIRRDPSGRALEAATGAGFWGVSPSVTLIMPSDPAVIFGTVGYTRNFGSAVDTVIPPVRVTYVKPGDSISASAGIGVSLNERTSFNLGYAHIWAFGTRTDTMLLDAPAGDTGMRSQTARDLQIGRLLFGVTYRVNSKASVNWSVEAGATDDATDLRTVLRIPITLITGR